MTSITRHIINKNMQVHLHNPDTLDHVQTWDYTEFCNSIDFWKTILVEKYNAVLGQTVYINLGPGLYYDSAIFAAMELGLPLILDWPLAYNETDLTSYQMTLHGPIDYVITDDKYHDPKSDVYAEWICKRDKMYGKNIIYISDYNNYKIKNFDTFNSMKTTMWSTADTPLLYSCSSGSTGLPKKIINSHRKVRFMADRLTTLLDFRFTDRVLHLKNLHHGAAMAYHFLPAYMIGKEHYHLVPMDYNDLSKHITFIHTNKITHVFLYLQQLLINFLRATPRAEHLLKITTLFNITEEVAQLVKDKNIEWVKTLFGDTTIGQGFFLKHVDQGTDLNTYDVANQGKILDDKFGIAVIDGRLHINIPELGEEWKTSNDLFDVINGDYYFRGRANRYRINEEWVPQADIETVVRNNFGEAANIVVDAEHEKIYLAIWVENPEAEIKVKEYFENTYKAVTINYIIRGENRAHFFNSRKINSNKIRDYSRIKLGLTHGE